MAEYSEATLRVFVRTLELLEPTLPAERLAALRGLLDAGAFHDLDALESALAPLEAERGD